jgi:hypothetical protein
MDGNKVLTSVLGWIDFSDEDQKRAQDYLRSLSSGTLDELGFGIIRDAFADVFFPATSTIMTRARYFILVPSIYLTVFKQGEFRDKAMRKCERMEVALRKQMIDNNALERARQMEVKRYPASVYWAGLRRLGIVNHYIGSQASYFEATQDAIQAGGTFNDDDHNAMEPENSAELWDAEFVRLFDANLIPKPNASGQFDSAIDFQMTKVESRYLRERFLEAETGSVVSNVFRYNTFEPADYPWLWDYPESIRSEIYHAQHFSMLAKIATLLYYRLLEAKRTAGGRNGCGIDLTKSIDDWWTHCREQILEWDIDQFLSWIENQKLARGSDRSFFSTLHRTIRELPSSKDLIAETEALIVVREKDKRPNKRRLVPGRFQNEWKLPTQRIGFFSDPKHLPYLLDFRSGIASQIIGDIFEGLG